MGTLTKQANVLLKDVASVGEKTVRAIVTAPTVDRDGDVIDTQSLQIPLKGGGVKYARELTGDEAVDIPFLTDHSFTVENVIGSVRSAFINALGELEVIFGISKRAFAQDMFTLLDEQHLSNAFSITVMYDYADIADGVIYNAEVEEISLVFRGSNRNVRLLAVTKSLLNKESAMSKDKEQSPELAAKYKKLAELTKEIEADEAAETTTPETPAPTPTTEPPVEDETPKPTVTETTEVTPEQTETKTPETKPNGEDTMTETSTKSIASKQAGTTPSTVEQPTKVKTVKDPNAHKLLVVKQIAAFNRKDWGKVKELNNQAKKYDEESGISSKAIKSKEISYDDASPLYLVEQLNKDVETCYGDYGNLAQAVTPITLTTSPKFSTIVQDGDVDFQPVGWAGEKPEDSASWSRISVEPEPFAVIQVWNDHVADDAAINLYDLMVQNVARGEARLEDRLITTFATTTATDGVVYPDQGILELMDSGQVQTYTAGDGEDFFAKLLAAFGSLRGCDRSNITLAMNGVKLFELAGLRNGNGDLIFNGNGTSLNLGLAGSFNFRTSDEIPTSDIIVGNFRKYYLGTKGGLELTTSNSAVVGELNLFTTDHSALRAVVRKEGTVSDASAAGAFAVVRDSSAS